jgi:hypothetical protein
LGRKDQELSYTQKWDGDEYGVETGKNGVTGLLNGREIFRAPAGLRVVSDWEGRVKSAANMAGVKLEGEFSAGAERRRFSLKPNESISFRVF